jgi:membrane protein
MEKSPRALLKTTFNDWLDDDALRLGASLAFYTVWSIGPLLLVVISVAGLAFGRAAAQGDVVASLRSLVGDAGAQSIQEAIVHANESGHTLLANVVGIIALLFAASGVFGELKSSLNIVWDVTPKPGSFWLTVKQRLLSVTMVLGTGFLLLVSLILSAALSAIGSRVHDRIPGSEAVWHVVHIVFSVGITAIVFTLMFKAIPDAKIGWEGRMARGFRHGHHVHRRSGAHRSLPRKDERGLRIWSRELIDDCVAVGLLLVVHSFSRR